MKFNYQIIYWLIVLLPFVAAGQIEISNVSEISKVKSGTTYIVMKDTASEKAKEYMEVYQQYWKISNFKFLNYSDLTQKLDANSSYFTISAIEDIDIYTSSNNNMSTRKVFVYLDLWTCSEMYFKKPVENRKFKEEYKNTIARIELSVDFEVLSKPEVLLDCDYDGGGHIRNWSPGLLKNQIQLLNMWIDNGIKKKLYRDSYNLQELMNLRKVDLYVPDYTLIKYNSVTGDESNRWTTEELYGDSKLNCKLITGEELSDKILDESKPIYYLVYIKSCNRKLVSVINSATGKVVYTDYTGPAYNISSFDFKKIENIIY